MSDLSLSTIDPFIDGLPVFSGRLRLPPGQKKKHVVIGISLPEKIANRLREEGARRGIGAASMLRPLVLVLIAALDREALTRAKADNIGHSVHMNWNGVDRRRSPLPKRALTFSAEPEHYSAAAAEASRRGQTLTKYVGAAIAAALENPPPSGFQRRGQHRPNSRIGRRSCQVVFYVPAEFSARIDAAIDWRGGTRAGFIADAVKAAADATREDRSATLAHPTQRVFEAVSTQAAAPQPRSVSVGLTEKAHATIVEEARRRGVTPERLTLAALLDYLGRNGKTQGAKASPLVLHVPWIIRKRIVEAAQAQETTPNRFMIAAAVKAIETSTTLAFF
jgi:hypothetical protein